MSRVVGFKPVVSVQRKHRGSTQQRLGLGVGVEGRSWIGLFCALAAMLGLPVVVFHFICFFLDFYTYNTSTATSVLVILSQTLRLDASGLIAMMN